MGGMPDASKEGGLLPVGAAAPAFRLEDVSGTIYSYGEDGSGKPLLLLFFSVFCEPCRSVLPVLQKVQVKNRDGRLEVAAISLDGVALRSVVAGFARQERYAFRVLLDVQDSRHLFRVADAYRVTEIPAIYVAGGRGRILFAGTGRITEDTLEKAVQSALSK